ncbi:MAG: hydroxymethylbilane synthase [Ilumatobacteraceae bacterium]
MPTLRLATRGSPQARTQAEAVAAALVRTAGCRVELVLVETTGDRRQDVPLHVIGGQGVFVKEVQQAVLDGLADAAVHSAKDLPSEPHPELAIGAFTARRDPADALVGRELADLAPGAPVATGSVRRRAQLRLARPDLRFQELRGNIATRLGKVPEGGSIVMAVAALQVLGLTEHVAERLDPTRFVPAPGQGCVALEVRLDDGPTGESVASVDDKATRHAVTVERSYLAELGAGCSLPLGAYVAGGRLHAFLASGDRDGADTFSEAIELRGDDGDDAIAAALARRAKEAVGW